MSNPLFKAIALILFGLLLIVLISAGLDRQEINECYTWREQAQEFDGYWITSWQKEQCEQHGIIINAQIK